MALSDTLFPVYLLTKSSSTPGDKREALAPIMQYNIPEESSSLHDAGTMGPRAKGYADGGKCNSQDSSHLHRGGSCTPECFSGGSLGRDDRTVRLLRLFGSSNGSRSSKSRSSECRNPCLGSSSVSQWRADGILNSLGNNLNSNGVPICETSAGNDKKSSGEDGNMSRDISTSIKIENAPTAILPHDEIIDVNIAPPDPFRFASTQTGTDEGEKGDTPTEESTEISIEPVAEGPGARALRPLILFHTDPSPHAGQNVLGNGTSVFLPKFFSSRHSASGGARDDQVYTASPPASGQHVADVGTANHAESRYSTDSRSGSVDAATAEEQFNLEEVRERSGAPGADSEATGAIGEIGVVFNRVGDSGNRGWMTAMRWWAPLGWYLPLLHRLWNRWSLTRLKLNPIRLNTRKVQGHSGRVRYIVF